MNTFTALIELLVKPARLKSVLSFNKKGYLKDVGWFHSFDSHSPIDQHGNPIPWVTYSFIDFIKEHIKKEHRVFEFGSGNSTYFYARYAGKVVSVEHDKQWYDKIVDTKPDNAELVYCELKTDGDYCRMPLQLNQQFDVVIVDGRDRINCCKQAIHALSPAGVIMLDDSEREFYAGAVTFLKENGFKQLSFSGISPGLFYNKATSVFYKPDNCLDI